MRDDAAKDVVLTSIFVYLGGVVGMVIFTVGRAEWLR